MYLYKDIRNDTYVNGSGDACTDPSNKNYVLLSYQKFLFKNKLFPCKESKILYLKQIVGKLNKHQADKLGVNTTPFPNLYSRGDRTGQIYYLLNSFDIAVISQFINEMNIILKDIISAHKTHNKYEL